MKKKIGDFECRDTKLRCEECPFGTTPRTEMCKAVKFNDTLWQGFKRYRKTHEMLGTTYMQIKAALNAEKEIVNPNPSLVDLGYKQIKNKPKYKLFEKVVGEYKYRIYIIANLKDKEEYVFRAGKTKEFVEISETDGVSTTAELFTEEELNACSMLLKELNTNA